MGEFIASTNEGKTNKHEADHHLRTPEPKDIDPNKPMARRAGEKQKPASISTQDNVSVGRSDQATFLSDGAGDMIANGEAGFSRRMLVATNAAANTIREKWEDSQLRSLAPDFSVANQQIRQRANSAEHQKDKAGEFGNTPSTTATYSLAEAWCKTHGAQIEADIGDEGAKFAAFNAWVPRANSFYSSLMRLRAQQEMLGAKDTDALVKQLVAGLGDVSRVAARMQLSHDQGHAESPQLPAVDGTLDQLSRETTLAATDMNTAYLGFQQNLLGVKEDAVNHTGDKAKADLVQIEQNKAFVRNAGKTIDLAMSVLDGAPAGIATATNAVKHADATLGAMANKRQIMSGARQTHNPTYVTADATGNMIVRNVQTGEDRSMITKPGEPSTHTPTPEEPIHLPSGVSDFLGQIADFAYAGEVARINSQLDQIATRCAGIQSVIDLNTTKMRIADFQNALNKFAAKCNDLQRRMAARRDQYLSFGVQLDNFSRTDHSSQKAGLSAGKGKERYATVMTVVSTVRETLAIGRSALNGFDSTTTLKSWIAGIVERRERTDDGRTDIPLLQIPGHELMPMVEMYKQVDGLENSVVKEVVRLHPVDDAASEILGNLSQGGSGSTSGGQY